MLWKSPQHECRGPYNRDGGWELDKSNSLFWKRINVFLENKKKQLSFSAFFNMSCLCHVIFKLLPLYENTKPQKKSFTWLRETEEKLYVLRETEEKLYMTAWDRRKAIRDCVRQKKSFTWLLGTEEKLYVRQTHMKDALLSWCK